MSVHKLSFLDMDEIRIIKQITIYSDYHYLNNDFVGFIVYARKLSNSYKLKNLPGDETRNGFNPNYPEQERFPNDDVDDIILKAIQNVHKKSTVRNSLKLFNVDNDNWKQFQSRAHTTVSFCFTPDISGMDIYELMEKQVKGLQIPANLYNNRPREIDNEEIFNGYFQFGNESILNNLDQVEFL
jgi:hypothetical protein